MSQLKWKPVPIGRFDSIRFDSSLACKITFKCVNIYGHILTKIPSSFCARTTTASFQNTLFETVTTAQPNSNVDAALNFTFKFDGFIDDNKSNWKFISFVGKHPNYFFAVIRKLTVTTDSIKMTSQGNNRHCLNLTFKGHTYI